ncbi:MAG TPA: hypothetical protein PLR50_02235 [Candidatus Rifleibacterium sp.]|nr:hypothetical protein [Candidatus Rifleibacterium sp.]
MLVKTRQPLLSGGCLVVFLLLIVCRAFGQPYDLPIRVIARADTHRLYYNYYSIRECLDIYNDDNLRPPKTNFISISLNALL